LRTKWHKCGFLRAEICPIGLLPNFVRIARTL
jgi:hypothetical protein